MGNHFQIPIVNINPMRMIFQNTFEDVSKQMPVQFLNMGGFQPVAMGDITTPEEMALIGNKLVSLVDPTKVIANDLYASSSRTGTISKTVAKMFGVTVDRIWYFRIPPSNHTKGRQPDVIIKRPPTCFSGL